MQTGRPTSDISNAGGWSDTSAGGELFDELDETSADDDTTKVTSGNKPGTTDTFEVKYQALTDPQDDTNHVYRYDATKTQGAQSLTIHCDLYQGSTLIRADSAHTLTTGIWDSFSVSLTTGQASGISDYSDLRLRCVPSTGGGGGQPAVAAVTWTELEIPDSPSKPPINISDTWTFAEQTSVTGSYVRSVTDTWTFSEQTQVVGMYVVSSGDTWTFTEQTDVTQTKTIDASDTWVFSEQTDVVAAYVISESDTWTFSEQTQVSGMFSVSANDVWTFAEQTEVTEGGGPASYTPAGKYIWFICSPASNSTVGCVFAGQCPSGEFIVGISEEGQIICGAP